MIKTIFSLHYLQNKITLIQMQNQEVPPTTTPCRRHHHLQQRGLLDSAQNGPLGHQQVAGTTSQRGHPRGRCIRKRWTFVWSFFNFPFTSASWAVWPDGKIFFNFWSHTTIKTDPIVSKIGQKRVNFFQILNKLSKDWHLI